MPLPVVVCDFSGVYTVQPRVLTEADHVVSLRDLSGTNCYCDEEAVREITGRTKELPVSGIHLIDSGNYHYMSAMWLKRLTRPFDLMVLDNHTDMQPPAFGDILSCGGWIAWAMEEIPLLDRVCLIGPPKKDFACVDVRLRERTVFVSREAIKKEGGQLPSSLLEFIRTGKPVYLSIDKDILRNEDMITGWSQGEMSLHELCLMMNLILVSMDGAGISLEGVDLCGEAPPDGPDPDGRNERANLSLLRCLKRHING